MRNVLLFALPICIGNILQQFYNTVDTLVIGNFCGVASLAAMSTSAQPVEMILCIFLGFGTSASILVSQYVGQEDEANLKVVISTAISFLYICSIPLSILSWFLGPMILNVMQVPADAWDYAVAYIRILLLGTLGNLGYNMNAGILRGLGDSASSLLFLVISCVMNIILDLIFVALLHMDVPGAALATILAMFASWFFSIIYIKRKYPELEFTLLPRQLNHQMLGSMVAIGLPLGLNNSIYSIGHILMQSLINAQGSAFMAACTVGGKLQGLFTISVNALSTAATTYAGQNLGAKNYVRLTKGALRIPLCSGLLVLVPTIFASICCRPILRLFTSDPQVLDLAVLYTWQVVPFSAVYAIFNAIICFINGIGEMRYPTIVNILTLWIVRIPCAYLIAHYFNGHYVITSMPISFIFGLCSMLLYFTTKRWKEIKELAKN